MNKEIKAAAVEVFERYPLAKKVFITSDNQAFLKEDRARLHDKDYTTVDRADVIEDDSAAPKVERKNAKELIETIGTCVTVEELDAIAEGEDRKTVLEAITARKAALTTK
jgi:hypothetical protein